MLSKRPARFRARGPLGDMQASTRGHHLSAPLLDILHDYHTQSSHWKRVTIQQHQQRATAHMSRKVSDVSQIATLARKHARIWIHDAHLG